MKTPALGARIAELEAWQFEAIAVIAEIWARLGRIERGVSSLDFELDRDELMFAGKYLRGFVRGQLDRLVPGTITLGVADQAGEEVRS